jgi:hypothetical protein
MSPHTRDSESAVEFAIRMNELHQEIIKRFHASNNQYKIQADSRQCHLEFDVGDYVMIRIRHERFPSGSVKTLHARSPGLFKVLK